MTCKAHQEDQGRESLSSLQQAPQETREGCRRHAMPKGKRISSESRLTMYNLHCEGWSPEDIFHVLFSNDTTRISLDHIAAASFLRAR